jgi:hypothetical protein
MSKLISLCDEISIYCPKIEILNSAVENNNRVVIIRLNGVWGMISERETNLYRYTPEKEKYTEYNSLEELIDALCSTLPNALEI